MAKSWMIDRRDVLETIRQSDGLQEAYISLAKLPAADVRENVRGRWIRKHDDICYWWECSHCGNRQPLNRWRQEWESPFCPNCGAQMMGGAE